MPTTLRTDLPIGVMTTAKFTDLDADLLARVRSDQVLVPLMSSNHDAMTVIARLQVLGYTGRITVVSMPLSNARMVESELRAQGPFKRLTLLTPQILANTDTGNHRAWKTLPGYGLSLR
jgi:hypothetical protein